MAWDCVFSVIGGRCIAHEVAGGDLRRLLSIRGIRQSDFYNTFGASRARLASLYLHEPKPLGYSAYLMTHAVC